jgi:hypothetical protein
MRLQKYITESFTPEEADSAIEKLKTGIKAPYVKVYKSTLGGEHRTSILITISLDPKEKWISGIIENSNYVKLHYSYAGIIEYISGRIKFRKTTVNSVKDAINKINRAITV